MSGRRHDNPRSRFPVRDANTRRFGGCPRHRTTACACEYAEPSVAGCGKALGEGQRILIEAGDRGWSTSALATCKSAWMCDHCAAHHQADTLERDQFHYAQHRAAGGRVMLLTLTMKHSLCDDLPALLLLLDRARTSLQASKAWHGLGIVDVTKTLDITYSLVNGWHPHWHLQLFLAPGSTATPEQIQAALAPVWGNRLQKRGRRAGRAGVDVFELAEVPGPGRSPWHYAPEVEDDPDRYHPDNWADWSWDPDDHEADEYHPQRVSRETSFPVWALAASSAAGNARAGALWDQYYRATKGRTKVGHSSSLNLSWKGRVETGSTMEQPGEPVARVPVALVESRLWNLARFHRRGSVAEFGLRVGERDGLAAMAALWSRILDRPVEVTAEAELPLVRLAPARMSAQSKPRSQSWLKKPHPPAPARDSARSRSRSQTTSSLT